MTRARESDGVEEEEKESSTKMASSFKIIEDLFLNWDGPDIVSESVEDWIRDFAGHSGKSTVGNFFQYCLSALSENFEEDFELTLWMMNLVAHYVADNESWLDTADELKNWGNLFLSEEDWEVPPPLWAITREKNSEEYRSWVEEEKLKELKEKKAEESLVTTSPLDLDWGKELPAPTPSVAAPSASMWTCGGPGRKMFLVSTCLLCRRGRGRVQLRQLVAGDDYRCGRRRRKWPDSH